MPLTVVRAFIVAGSLTSSPLISQQVLGTARLATAGNPISGVSVVLVDQSGVIIAGTITASDGRYSLQLPRKGRYVVRARRVGFTPDSTIVGITDQGVRFDPQLKPFTFELQAVRIEGENRCTTSSDADTTVLELWNAVQNALTATVATAFTRGVVFRLKEFEREVEPGTGRILRGTTRELRGMNAEPYHSISPESLAVRGFAFRDRDSTTYFAPDARTLTSETFSRSHCFRAVKDWTHPGQIGLAFRPRTTGPLVDVRGTLWVDAKSGSLRDLEYDYAVPPAAASKTIAGTSTGRVEYRELDQGAWIVNRWAIRVPGVVDSRGNAVFSADPIGAVSVRSSLSGRVTTVWEVGGEVLDVRMSNEDSLTNAVDLGAVHGSVVSGDANSAPIANVTVELASEDSSRTIRKIITSVDGIFAFDSVAAGDYRLTVHAPLFDTLNTAVQPIPVQVPSGVQQTVTIKIPSAEEGKDALCSGTSAKKGAILHGYVLDSISGRVVAGARVEAYWLTGTIRNTAGGLSAVPHQVRTLTDLKGRFVFCGLDPTDRLVLSASVGARKTRRIPSITLSDGAMRFVTLIIAGTP